jgi:SAM-dependent methyltransferase
MAGWMYVTEDDALIQRYCENYGCAATLTADQVNYHLSLEIELTARLLASTPESRWATFQECYDELYGSLPWLAGTGGVGDLNGWNQVIGPPPQRLYEIGSGDGGLARALASLGYEVVATDVSVRRGRERQGAAGLTWGVTDGVHLDRFTELEAYDVVISDQLVEHLHPDDIGEHLRGCRSILRPGGRYIVQTPHAFTGPHDVSSVFGYEEPVGMHLREYTTAELKRELRRAGFSSVKSVLRFPGGRRVASSLHLGYLGVIERMLGDASRATKKKVSLRLRGPLRPRIFLVARR